MEPQTDNGVIPGTEGLSGAGDPSAQAGAPAVQSTPIPAGATQVAAPTPAPQQAAPSSSGPAMAAPGTPHAGLRNMLQSLFLGMDAFATSAATGGKEGGAEEVQRFRAQQQKMQLDKQAGQREQAQSDASIQHMQAMTNMETARLTALQMSQPLELTKMQNEVFSSEVKVMQEAGFTPQEISMIEGQSTEAHVAGVNAKAGGDLVNNAVFPVHSDNGIGKGGTTYLNPYQKMQKITLTGDKLTAMIKPLQRQIDTAKAVGLGDKPEIQAAQGKLDVIAEAAAKGGSMKLSDFHNLAVVGAMSPVSQVMSQQKEIATRQKELADAQKAQSDAQAAARPKDLNDAVGRLTQAQQAFKTAPTPENQLGVTAAQTAVNVFQREDAKAAAQKTFATKSAELNAMDANDAKNAPALIDAAKNYQLNPEKLFGLRGQQRANFMAALLQQDPTWSMAKYKSKFDTVQDFSPSGKVGEQIRALNTFAGHAADAMGLVDTLRNTGSPLINAPMNKVAEALGNDKIGPFNTAMMAAKEEYQNFLKGGHAATKEEIERVEKLGSASSTPAVNQAILKQMSQTVLIRAGSLNGSYKGTMGTDFPNMFTPEGAQAMVKLGHPEVSKFGVAGAVGGPAAATFNPKTDFKPITPTQ
jgi:hypothetical protein